MDPPRLSRLIAAMQIVMVVPVAVHNKDVQAMTTRTQEPDAVAEDAMIANAQTADVEDVTVTTAPVADQGEMALSAANADEVLGVLAGDQTPAGVGLDVEMHASVMQNVAIPKGVVIQNAGSVRHEVVALKVALPGDAVERKGATEQTAIHSLEVGDGVTSAGEALGMKTFARAIFAGTGNVVVEIAIDSDVVRTATAKTQPAIRENPDVAVTALLVVNEEAVHLEARQVVAAETEAPIAIANAADRMVVEVAPEASPPKKSLLNQQTRH
ncbi:MAG: hypothetical protein MPJ50_08125 [Pirellulales bacterium]|nr:hypothetical protein [Pirellulales bacterium]